MSITLLHHAFTASTNTILATTSTTAGNLLLCLLTNTSTSATWPGSVTLSGGFGGTFTQDKVGSFASGGSAAIYSLPNVVSGGVQINLITPGTACRIFYAEFTGVATTSPFDQNGAGTGSFGTSVSFATAGTPVQADELIIAAVGMGATSPTVISMTAPTGAANIDVTSGTATAPGGWGWVELTNANAGAVTSTITWTTMSNAQGVSATYKAAGGAAQIWQPPAVGKSQAVNRAGTY